MSKAETEMIKAMMAGTAAENASSKEFNLAVEELREWYNHQKAKGDKEHGAAILAIGYVFTEITA